MKTYPICALRGATTVQENTESEILSATAELVEVMLKKNGIKPEEVISVLFSCTKDLDAVYPAVALRDKGLELGGAAVMCFADMDVAGSLPLCIRAVIYAQSQLSQDALFHVYLREAERLRPDRARRSIAIDGPAGAGKSTVARDVAGRLGFVYVDTGAMYRAAALYGIENGYNLDDLGDIEKFIGAVKLRLERGEDGGQRVLLDGRDVTGRLREAAVAEGSSKVAVCRRVREAMVLLQREAAARNNVVMDGRDIGTVVLPCADLKIYLRASAETRARRRFDEEREKGGAPVFDRILEDIRERDLRDSAREHSPLRQAEGAVVLDTDGLSREEAAERVIELWNARGN